MLPVGSLVFGIVPTDMAEALIPFNDPVVSIDPPSGGTLIVYVDPVVLASSMTEPPPAVMSFNGIVLS